MCIDNTPVQLQIWDTGGSERYRSMAPMYYQGANAACIVYDITSQQSFQEVETWLTELREKGPASLVVALVGNKSDTVQGIQVPEEDAEDYAREKDIQLVTRTSALTGDNIAQLFQGIAQKALGHMIGGKEGGKSVILGEPGRPEKKDSSCC
jgi:small GTP-binding protein